MQSLDKWRTSFSTPLRRRWIKGYIKNIGADNLSRMGYDKVEILASVTSTRNSYVNLISDAARMLYGALDSRFQISLIRRLHRERKGKRKYTLQ